MKKFEYKTLEFHAEDRKFTKMMNVDTNEIENELNELGNEGWELINSIDYNVNGFTVKVVLFFKREKN